MEREKVVAVIPSEGEGSHKRCNVQAPFVFAREILHFVQDDRRYGGVMHGVVLKWNDKK
jgi:hypothetical protein